jgi:hypothetical protein
LLLFVIFLLLVNFGSYFLLSKGVRFVTFCTFFTAGNYDKLFFTGPGELLCFIVQGGNLKGCTLIFYFFIVEGGGGGGMEFFYGPFIGNVEGGGGKGVFYKKKICRKHETFLM